MQELITEYPLWVMLFLFFGALFAWFSADQFRAQILSDNHPIVRVVALRYLQILIGLFAVFVFGMVLVVFTLLGSFARTVGDVLSPMPSETPVQTLAAAAEFQGLAETQVGQPVILDTLPVSTLAVPAISTSTPEVDAILAGVKTARVFNTNGVGANARDVPGLGGAVLVVVPEGEVVALSGEEQFLDGFTWLKVTLPNGTQAWIANQFLELTSE